MKTVFFNIWNGIIWIINTATYGQWCKLWDWIKLVHSQSDEASSKRFYGGILVLSCVVSFYLFSAEVFSLAAWQEMAPYWTFLLVMGIGLISVSLIEKIAGIIANFKITQITGKQ